MNRFMLGARVPKRDDQGTAPLFVLDGVSKSFGAVAALRDVRLELHAGEAHALVGENGAGIGTKAEVHRLLSTLAADGVAVVMVSSELTEVLGMADRVLVMHEGRLTHQIPRDRADEESVMLAATGHGGVA